MNCVLWQRWTATIEIVRSCKVTRQKDVSSSPDWIIFLGLILILKVVASPYCQVKTESWCKTSKIVISRKNCVCFFPGSNPQYLTYSKIGVPVFKSRRKLVKDWWRHNRFISPEFPGWQQKVKKCNVLAFFKKVWTLKIQMYSNLCNYEGIQYSRF